MTMVLRKCCLLYTSQTANCEPLMDITKSYGLDRIWINAEVAERLGIADGDEVIDVYKRQEKSNVR